MIMDESETIIANVVSADLLTHTTTLEERVPTIQIHDVVKPINKQTIHKICSGQVVLSLAVAVKELVENALDAGATIIDVKLKEHGCELVEVSDNGTGVMQKNFAALTEKHCTSKITDFSDLETVKTLGFRGEALSSLCALCNVTITTRHVSAVVGTKITYDHSGKIMEECTAPRLQGTTVSLANLFCTLPVRRKEFVKNLKREFTKMCQLLYAYCLVSVGVKITCFNQTSTGTKTKVVSTQGSNSVRDNIINIFGAKQISSLVEMLTISPEDNILQEYGIKISPGEDVPFKIICFISSAMHGSGRSTADRQFFYINSRPCEPVSVMKLCNETYRQYNGQQYPFVYMNILTSTSKVDVNVTPDKRQIFLEKEKLLLAVVKASLIETFKNFPSTYNVQNLNISSKSEQTIQSKFMQRSPLKCLKRSNSENNAPSLDIFRKKAKKDDEKVNIRDLKAIFGKLATNGTNKILENQSLTSNSSNKISEMVNHSSISHYTIEHEPNLSLLEASTLETKITESHTNTTEDKPEAKTNEYGLFKTSISDTDNNTTAMFEQAVENRNLIPNLSYEEKVVPESEILRFEDVVLDNSLKDRDKKEIVCKLIKSQTKDYVVDSTNASINISKFDEKLDLLKVETNVLDVSLSEIQDRLNKKLKLEDIDDEKKSQVLFRTQICPSANQAAEQELQKRITKDKFEEMEILGQFNLGFIISRLGDDLFIIDQHATDEKYNFEQLQINTVLKTQVLVNPKPLNLMADKECLLIENIEIFRKNGFVFDIDESAEPNQKIKLTAIPISKNYAFGVDDIDELLFMLQDSSHTMCRPTRVRQMFASRACRKSVMIGKALTHSDMRKLVDHMGEIDQPWNCPHGRPTMRHLLNLNLIHSE